MSENVVDFPQRTLTQVQTSELVGGQAHPVVHEIGETGGSAVVADVKIANALLHLLKK